MYFFVIKDYVEKVRKNTKISQSGKTPVPKIDEGYVTQVSEETKSRDKETLESSVAQIRILGALSK